MKTFLIYSPAEKDRLQNISRLQDALPEIQLVHAIYPALQKVPFLKKIEAITAERTGKALLPGEIGCLLSHRSIWNQILKEPVKEDTHFLILESDSMIMHQELIQKMETELLGSYDLFFWGAWDGHMKLFRKNRKRIGEGFEVGTPFIKTIYCTYGYSVTKKTAQFLLERTGKFSYPVDQYKRFLSQSELNIGGVIPELICSNGSASNIRSTRKFGFMNELFLAILDIKNYMICFFR